jgi:hypothetical protein
VENISLTSSKISNNNNNNKVRIATKLSLRLINKASRHKDVLGSGGIAPAFLTSELEGGEWLASRPGRITLGESVRLPTV